MMERLRFEQAEAEYAAMVGAREPVETFQSVSKEISNQVSVIFNILFSSIFTGLAIWYATSNLSTYRHRQAMRVGASVATAFIVAIAEIVLYDSYRRKMDEAKAKERSFSEVTTLAPELSS